MILQLMRQALASETLNPPNPQALLSASSFLLSLAGLCPNGTLKSSSLAAPAILPGGTSPACSGLSFLLLLLLWQQLSLQTCLCNGWVVSTGKTYEPCHLLPPSPLSLSLCRCSFLSIYLCSPCPLLFCLWGSRCQVMRSCGSLQPWRCRSVETSWLSC